MAMDNSMAANPIPLLALAAGAFFILRKKDDAVKGEGAEAAKPGTGKATALPTEEEQVAAHKEEAKSGNVPDRIPREPMASETFNVIREVPYAEILEPVTFRPRGSGDTLAITDFDDDNSVYWLAGRLRDGQNNLLAELAKDSAENVLSLRSPTGQAPAQTIKLMRTNMTTDEDVVIAYFGPRPPSLGVPVQPLVVRQISMAEAVGLPDGQKPALRPEGPREAIQIDGFDGALPNVAEGTLFFIAETGDVDADPITLRVLEKNQTGEGDVIAWM
jgi:hypothetical protein